MLYLEQEVVTGFLVKLLRISNSCSQQSNAQKRIIHLTPLLISRNMADKQKRMKLEDGMVRGILEVVVRVK